MVCETTLTELLERPEDRVADLATLLDRAEDIEDASQLCTVGCCQQEEHYEVEDGLHKPGAAYNRLGQSC